MTPPDEFDTLVWQNHKKELKPAAVEAVSSLQTNPRRQTHTKEHDVTTCSSDVQSRFTSHCVTMEHLAATRPCRTPGHYNTVRERIIRGSSFLIIPQYKNGVVPLSFPILCPFECIIPSHECPLVHPLFWRFCCFSKRSALSQISALSPISAFSWGTKIKQAPRALNQIVTVLWVLWFQTSRFLYPCPLVQ